MRNPCCATARSIARNLALFATFSSIQSRRGSDRGRTQPLRRRRSPPTLPRCRPAPRTHTCSNGQQGTGNEEHRGGDVDRGEEDRAPGSLRAHPLEHVAERRPERDESRAQCADNEDDEERDAAQRGRSSHETCLGRPFSKNAPDVCCERHGAYRKVGWNGRCTLTLLGCNRRSDSIMIEESREETCRLPPGCSSLLC
jgi:hypothetical protein